MDVEIGKLYKHFKGNMYRVLHVAMHTETGEKMVIYQDVYDEEKIYARPYDMFISKVDTEKYPEVTAEYRFTLFDENDSSLKVNPKVLEFLDADGLLEKMSILREMRSIVTNDMLNTMAYSMDLELNDGEVEERFNELYNCIALREKMEGGRLRG